MNCPERERLVRHCAATEAAFAEVSVKWAELTENPVTDEYWDCRKAREEARIEVRLAHTELEHHELRHGCERCLRGNDGGSAEVWQFAVRLPRRM
jgi:hypothetical protein